jgi:hypothetical protein
MSDLEAIEEVAIAAMLEGEPLKEYLEESKLGLARFRDALFYALRAQDEGRDACVLLVRRVEGEEGLRIWLAGLLGAIQERQWRASFHLDGAAPVHRGRWSVSHDAQWMAEKLEVVVQERHNVLIMVRGADAGSILALEAGMQQFDEVPGRKTPAQIYIELLRLKPDLSVEDWGLPQVQIGALDKDVIQRMKPVRRVQLDQGRVHSSRASIVVEQSYDAYWAQPEALGTPDLLHLNVNEERWGSVFTGVLDALDLKNADDDIPF